MSINVRFFASLRESLGKAEDSFELDSTNTVKDVWSRSTEGADMPVNTLCSVNLEYVDPEHTVKDGDEVAFFPPVTGG